MRAPNIIVTAIILIAATLLATPSMADQIRLGFTGPLSGPSMQLGQQLVEGIELGFKRLNASQKLPFSVSLVAKDDGYEPSRTVPSILEMIDQDNIIGLISSVGTPTTVAAIPTLQKSELPLISPVTGSSMLDGKDINHLIFSNRASYYDEALLLTKTITQQFKIDPSEIAVFVQKDSYGDVTMRSVIQAFKQYGLKNASDVLRIHYARNQSIAAEAAAKILEQPTPPKAIFLISTYPAAAGLINLLDDIGISPLYVAISFVSHEALNERLGNTNARVLASHVHPCMNDLSNPLIQDFIEDTKKYGDPSSATTITLEGYIAARSLENTLLYFHPHKPPSRSELLDYLRRYQLLQKDTETTKVDNKQLGHNESGIWLELNNHHSGQVFCGSSLQDDALKGSL